MVFGERIVESIVRQGVTLKQSIFHKCEDCHVSRFAMAGSLPSKE
jgi:hypothetical protein